MAPGNRDFDGLLGRPLTELSVGMSAEMARTVTEADIFAFAGVSGDTNPVHLDAEFADNSMFKGRIAHGMLSAGYISAVVGTKLPGPGSIYISQTLKFKAPVRLGDTVLTRATVKAITPEKNRITMTTECFVDGNVVVTGEAELMVPPRKN